jgi:tricorn protease
LPARQIAAAKTAWLTAPSPFMPELAGTPAEAEGPGQAPATVGLDVAGLAGRIAAFPVEAGRYAKLSAAGDGVTWLELPPAGEMGETMIGAAEEHPTRLIRYDLAKRERSVEVSALDDYCVSNDGTQLAGRHGRERLDRDARPLPAAARSHRFRR